MSSDTSLVFNVLAIDRASKTFRKIRDEAISTKATLIGALGPALLPVLAASTAAVAGLAGALSGVGAASAVFGAVFKSSFAEVQQASQKTDDLREKVRLLGEEARIAPTDDMRGKFLDQQAKAATELQARLNLLPPATRATVVAYGNLKTAWSNFVDQNKPQTYAIMTGGFSTLARIIPMLQPLFDVAAEAVSRLVTGLKKATDSGGIQRLVGWLSGQAGPAFVTLTATVKNLAVVIGNVFASFAPTGQGILTWLADVTGKWAAWSQQANSGGLKAFAAYATSQGPRVVGLLSSIASAGVHIVQAVTPLAPISLAIARALAAILAALPPGVITVLVAAWVAYTVALRGYLAYAAIVGAATKAWAAVQWLLNVAMDANPIGLIVLGIAALVAAIVWIATKTTWFQTIWRVAWGAIKVAAVAVWHALQAAASAVWNALKWYVSSYLAFWRGAWNLVRTVAGAAWDWVKGKAVAFYNWITGIPGKVSAKLSTMWNGLKSGFRTALNWVIGKWNGLRFSIPSFNVLGMNFGGGSIGVPSIPYMATGGSVLSSGLAMIHKGEEVRPAKVTRKRGSDGPGRLVIDLRGADGDLKRVIRGWIRTDNLLNT